MNMTDFYQKHLDRVSRSFAFCIRELRQPLRDQVSLAYLLCRILDTLEDSPFPEFEGKINQIICFDEFILDPPSKISINEWAKLLPSTYSEAEAALLSDVGVILDQLHKLEEPQKKILQKTILKMSGGMREFLKKSHEENQGELVLKSLEEVDRYCFFVAGIVGEMLTELMAQLYPDFILTEQQVLHSHQFGGFLQKINLLKDQAKDEKLGRRLVPNRAGLEASLKEDAEGALHYLLKIPLEARDYRLFCGWSLFLGLASLPWIQSSWRTKIMEKIPRNVTEKILARVTNIIDDNEKLSAVFSEMNPASTAAVDLESKI